MNNKPVKHDDAAEKYEFDNLKIENDESTKLGFFGKLWNHVKTDNDPGKFGGTL